MEFNPQFTSIWNTLFPSKDNEAAVKLELQDVGRVLLNAPKIAGCSGNSPYTNALVVMRLKLQKQSALKFFSRIIMTLAKNTHSAVRSASGIILYAKHTLASNS